MTRSTTRAELDYFVDQLNAEILAGWALSAHGISRIQVSVDGRSVGEAKRGIHRPDIQAAFPEVEDALECGFEFRFPKSCFAGRVCEVSLAFELSNGKSIETPKTRFVNPQSVERTLPVLPAMAPFPADVLDLLGDLMGAEALERDWSESRVANAVDELILAVQRGSTPGLFPYLRYLNSVRAHGEFVARHFPSVNPRAAVGAKDEVGIASSPEEMLCIASHLYVLKSRGVTGRLLEFGCFKGFSTACLSFACHELGIGFDVFDSFEGLPHAEADYYAKGEFAGALDEVKANVREFGRIDCVEFHKGFFSDTLPTATIDPLLIWMDVDLYSSSRDVMTILPALPRRSCVFTHESLPSQFSDGRLIPDLGPNSPLDPIADAFEKLGRPLRGRFLHGNTAALWEGGVAIPVLPYDQLNRLLELC